MRELPVITLVTPSFRQAEFIERTMESVVVQEYPRLDWWVMDALSDDGTAEILERYRGVPGLTIVREKDGGQGDAIAKGFARGNGEVLGWLNSDDVLLPGALRAVGEAFREWPEAGLIYGAGWKVDETGRRTKRVAARAFDRRAVRSAFTILQPAMFFRRAVYEAAGGLDISLQYAMDWELVMRLAERAEVRWIEQDLAELRCYAGTKSETGGWERFREIAAVGRRMNGVGDRNFLAYLARRAAVGSRLPGARRAVDFVLSKVYADRSVMVVGWPGEKV